MANNFIEFKGVFMVNKKTIFLGVFAVFAMFLPLKGMEERGSKRSFEQANSQKEEKSEKYKKVRTEANEHEEYVILKTFDGQEIQLLAKYARCSQTLCYYMDAPEFNCLEPISLSYNSAFTKENLEYIKKLLLCIYNDNQDLEIDTELFVSILKRLRASTEEAQQLHDINAFLDLDKQLTRLVAKQDKPPKGLFYFFAEDGQKIAIAKDILKQYSYFFRLINAGMRESCSKQLYTNLPYLDLKLLITLLNYFHSYKQEIASLLQNVEVSEDKKRELPVCLVNAICAKVEELFVDDKNAILEIIQQAHQWELHDVVKGLMKFLLKRAFDEDIGDFMVKLSHEYCDDFFSSEVINKKNVVNVASIFIKKLHEQLLKTASQDEKETGCEVSESFLRDTAFKGLTLFVDYFKKEPLEIDALIHLLRSELDFFIDNYEKIMSTLEMYNKDMVAPLNGFMKSILAYSMRGIHQAFYTSDGRQSIVGFLSGNRCIVANSRMDNLYVFNYLTRQIVLEDVCPKNVLGSATNGKNVCVQHNDDTLKIIKFDENELKISDFAMPDVRIITVLDDYIVVQDKPHNKLYILDDGGKEKYSFDFDGNNRIADCLLLNENTLILLFDCYIAQVDFEQGKISIIYKNLENCPIVRAVRLSEEKFIVGYGNGKLSIFNTKGFIEDIKSNDVIVGAYNNSMILYVFLNIFMNIDGNFLIQAVSKDGLNEEVSCWETSSRKHIDQYSFPKKALLKGVQGGYLVFLRMSLGESEWIIQFSPLIATTQEIVEHLRRCSFKFLYQ